MKQPAPAYRGKEPYVFVSYSHRDEGLVFREIRWLQDQGINVWYDTQIQAGSEWSDALAHAIDGCSRFIYFITPSSVASENCRRELNHALEESRSVLAVHLRRTDVPSGIRLNLNNRQAILKHRLKPDDYQSRLLEALSSSAETALEPRITEERSASNWQIKLASVVAVVVLAAIAAIWLWQKNSVDPARRAIERSLEVPLKAIAVLPFDDLSPNGDHAWLATGLADDLIEALSRVEGLFVPARRSTSILKAQGADLDTIGKRLAVGTVVEGSVQASGDKLSVLARWVRVEDGSSLWSARYERNEADILLIQREITVGIAEAIRTELGIQDAPASLLRQRYEVSDVRAWELFKKAYSLSETVEPYNLAQARRMLQQALEYDPRFAEARLRVAYIDYLGDLERGIEGFKAVYREDPSSVSAISAFMYDSAFRFWDYQTAEELLERIPEHRRSFGTYETAFHVYASTGRLHEALSAAESAVRLDPMWARGHCYVGFAHDWSGNWELAIPHYERALAVQRESGQFGVWCVGDLASAYHRAGRDSEVVPAILDSGQWTDYSDVIRRGWESGGWKGMNLAWADEWAHRQGRSDTSALGRSYSSCAYGLLANAGVRERMYTCLETEMSETAIADRYPQVIRRELLAQALRVRSAFASYRQEPRFRALLRRLDERMEKAAGTYDQKVGLSLTP